MLTPRDIDALRALALYYVLNRPQIQRLCFQDDRDGRITRRRLQTLVECKFIHRHTLFAFHPLLNAPAPVYYPSRKGAEFLAEHFGDERFLLTCTQPPQPNNLLHWLAISDTHIILDEAVRRQDEVQVAGWLNEWDVANKDESLPEKRFRLYVLLSASPRLVCAPDAAFLLALRGFRKVFYLEQDRATTGVQQLAASRPKGYASLAERSLHRRHFLDTNLDTFTVLMVTTHERRRDQLQKAFRQAPGSHLWRFAAQSDLTPENILHAPIWFPCDGPPAALVKPDARSDANAPQS